MRIPPALLTSRARILGISILSGFALGSSLYLQYAARLEPCLYCYVLRYLTTGVLAFSIGGLLFPRWTADISAAIAALGFVGMGVSVYLILEESFPASSICTCSYAPLILGISLYYYALAFTGIVLGISITVFKTG